MIPLPLARPVTSCDGCGGACCRGVGSPPGLLWDYDNPDLAALASAGAPMSAWPLSEWGRSLPADLLADLLDYFEAKEWREDQPCF
jgi:hypothetical protein